MRITFSSVFLIVILLATAATGGWFFGRQSPAKPLPASDSGRKPLFYQSPMHPWIKSDQPGDCTICGMKLVPVFAGGDATDSPGENLVKLSPQSQQILHVATEPVMRQPLRRSLHVAGRIDDDDSSHRRLSATVEGRIEKLFVNSVGAEVTQGQPLAAFFSRELIVARGEYALALKQPPSPERENGLAGSRAKLRRLGLAPEQIEKLVTQTGDAFELLAPISGTVVERKVYEGQYVKEGDVLFEIADFSKMWFVADVYERDLAWVRVGQMVEISTPTVPGKTFTAPIAFIDPNVAENTRTARIRVVIDNPHVGDPALHRHELLHRVFADGFIKIEMPETLTVARSAVLSAGAASVVYVAKADGVYEARPVQLGRVGDAFYEVLSGVAEGEMVVTNGNLLIDAQAQLDRGGRVDELEIKAADHLPALTSDQRTSAKELFSFADALAARLAVDDLIGFNERVDEAVRVGAKVAATFDKTSGWHPFVAKVVATTALPRAADLTLARKVYHPLSEAVVAWIAELRKHDPTFASLKIYRCPMTADAFPGAPAKAAWMQLAPPLHNPYFGAQMPDCGAEVKP